MSAVGCADESSGQYELAGSTSSQDAKTQTAIATSKPVKSAESFNVHGTIADQDMASQAVKVHVLALAADGTTTPVTSTDVNSDGTFDVSNLSGSSSPTGLFILSLENIGQDIIGSGLVNGALPLLKGVVLDAPIDTLTSLKTNVIQQIATGKAPGLQNYVNVVEAFINDELLNAVQLGDGVQTDSTTLIGGISDAIVAGENVIESTLKSAGVNVDLSALQGAQAQVVKGLDDGINSGVGDTITGGTELVSGIESAIQGFTGPVDQTIFNAVANGGTAFSNTVSSSSSSTTHMAFAAKKSSFHLQTALSTSSIKNSFAQSSSSTAVGDALTTASQAFMDDVNNASSVDDLNTAKSNFMTTLLGNTSGAATTGDDDDDATATASSSAASSNPCCILQIICCIADDVKQIWYGFDSMIKPYADQLSSAYGSGNSSTISSALQSFDAHTASWQTTLPGLDASSSKAFSDAVRLVQKQIAK